MKNRLAEDLDHVLRHTTALWDDLRGARLLLTGGTGFFGTWLLESLAWANRAFGLDARAYVLSRNPEAFRARATHLMAAGFLHFEEGDIRTFTFPPGHFTHLIHAATPPHATARNEPDVLRDVTVNGTRRALEFARASGVRRMLFTSSGAVYGSQPPELEHVGEDYLGIIDPRGPHAAYAEAKRAAEQLCVSYQQRYELAVSIARPFAFVGPHLPLDAQFAVGNFLRDGLHGGPIRVNGDGTPYRSYLYAADLAIWLWTILVCGKPARAYNVGCEDDLTIAALALRVAQLFRTEAVIARQPVPGAAPQRYVPSTARARAELGLRSLVGLDEALERTARWHWGD